MDFIINLDDAQYDELAKTCIQAMTANRQQSNSAVLLVADEVS
jgi:hypothetical protein